MNQVAEYEQIRRFVAAHFPDMMFTDDDIESIAAMPVAAHLCEREIRDLNTLLRTLPNDLLAHLQRQADDLADWSDLREPDTWPHELTVLAVILSDDEIRDDEERYLFRLSLAVARLGALVFIEIARRNGAYSFVRNYDLARDVRTVPCRSSDSEH